jgi:hypothetical protein
MPRPYPPAPILPSPAPKPFPIGDQEKADLARVLGLDGLPPKLCEAISHAIGCYQATKNGSKDTTVGNTLAALGELTKSSRAYKKAVQRLADERGGIDYTTHEILQPLSTPVLKDEPGSREALAQAAEKRIEELRAHERVAPPTESLRFFCGVLRLIFNQSGSPALSGSLDESWQRCRKFAMEVFMIAGIDHADFDSHPERLTEYLGTDVSVGQRPG